MLVGDLMTADPKTIEDHEPVAVAMEIMGDFHIRHLPVLRRGKLVGILSDRDLRSHAPPTEVAMEELGTTMDLMDRAVAAVMSREPQSVGPRDTIASAIDLMLEWRIGSVCVVDEGALVGILSHIDLLRVLRPFAEQLDGVPPESLS